MLAILESAQAAHERVECGLGSHVRHELRAQPRRELGREHGNARVAVLVDMFECVDSVHLWQLRHGICGDELAAGITLGAVRLCDRPAHLEPG